MATNLPVVATDDPIRREIVGKAGKFADPQNPSAFAAQINLALEAKWGNLPQKQAQSYSWDKIVNSYSKLIQQLS
jgi:glycosyltransferase involved in cell wall biosynthesis